ncbi:uncharacterized protein LOC142504311 [Primulina tabacum]|uniref:uncharacterized protein LOC142504311 n=1 Tax=Primulina tabacum TaxID=48773 RepID=UPI003F59FB4D
MISEGSRDGKSNQSWKARGKRECREVEGARRNDVVISFGPDDLPGVSLPHNEALVIQARVSNYDVMWVFVDSDSSVNVIFKEALVQMDLQGYQLETVETALFGFAGHAVFSEGEIILPLTLGTRELRKIVMTTFTIKFSVENHGWEVRGDQSSSHKCYVEIVWVDQKKARQEEKGVSRAEEIERIVKKGEIHFVAEEEQEHESIRISSLVAEHNLNIIPGSQPVKQKKLHFGTEKDKVIDVHVQELLQAGHIREIQFPTRLSNVALVPKGAGKWRLCVDFRDLNMACPKDHYPLPRINQLVDYTSCYELLNFMVGYQGYHKIPLVKNDQDNANFITSRGTFCYVVMPFGLNNVGFTYQRLMN